jgi:hypothetical protein
VRNETASKGRRIARIGLAAVALTAVLFEAPSAAAFCRTTSCPGVGTAAKCTPPQFDDCGKELFWAKPCIGFSIQKDASTQVSLETATDIFETAFRAWTDADCGGGTHPRISVVNLGPVACDVHEYNKKAGNANVIMFHDDAWPHAGAGSTLALTTVTYNVETGEIYDADMELNSANVEFTTSDVNVKFDLLSIATHETGHFLGMSHSPDPDATMFANYQMGDTEQSTLAIDDIAGICAAYPPGESIPADCDPSPRRGLASECSPPPTETEQGGCCGVAPGAPRSSSLPAVGALVFALGLGARITRRSGARARRP